MAGTAPPVMLMICWFTCGPRLNRENGSESEIPGCRIKFELSSRKNINRNAKSTSGNKTSQPKLYSFVRRSFMKLRLNFAFDRLTIATQFTLGRRFRPRLKTDDSAYRQIFGQH